MILGGRETDIFFVVDNAASFALFEGLEDVDRAIRGVVINNDDLLERIILIEDGFQAAFNKAATVVCDDRYRNEVATRHVCAGRLHSKFLLPFLQKTLLPCLYLNLSIRPRARRQITP